MRTTSRCDHEGQRLVGEVIGRPRKVAQVRNRQVVDRKVVIDRVIDDRALARVGKIGNGFERQTSKQIAEKIDEGFFPFAADNVIDMR